MCVGELRRLAAEGAEEAGWSCRELSASQMSATKLKPRKTTAAMVQLNPGSSTYLGAESSDTYWLFWDV